MTRYAYDSDGRTVSITSPADLVTTFEYDASGQRTKTRFANDTTATSSYDAAGRLSAVLYAGTDGAVQEQISYTFDRAGNVLERSGEIGDTHATPEIGDTHATPHGMHP